MISKISWFEIPAIDIKRAENFYNEIFSFKMIKQEAEDNIYQMRVFPNDNEGCLISGDGYEPSESGIIIYLDAGEDLDKILKKVVLAGGKIYLPKTLIPDNKGYFAIIRDTEANRIGLYSHN